MRSKFIFGHPKWGGVGWGGGASQCPACKTFGDIHSIFPWANTPILVVYEVVSGYVSWYWPRRSRSLSGHYGSPSRFVIQCSPRRSPFIACRAIRHLAKPFAVALQCALTLSIATPPPPYSKRVGPHRAMNSRLN